MALESLRLLLLRKAAGDAAIEQMICETDDLELEDAVIDSLIKVEYDNAGKGSNEAVKEFAASTLADPTMVDMARHAVGHHVSRYKAALKAGDKRLAGQHANQAFRTLNMLTKARAHIRHEPGAYELSTVSPHPWQHNVSDRHRGLDVGRLSDREWNNLYGGASKEPTYPSRNYDHLNMAPPSSIHHHREVKGQHENSAYPFEKTRIGGAYIPIDHDIENPGKFEEHPFDRHPVMQHAEIPAHKFGPHGGPLHQQYLKGEEEFANSPHFDKFLEMQQAAHEKYGEDRASNPFYGHPAPSLPVHDELPAPQVKPEPVLRQPAGQEAAPAAPAASGVKVPHVDRYHELKSVEQAHKMVSSPVAKKLLGEHIEKIHGDTGGIFKNPQVRSAYDKYISGGKK